MAHIGIGTLDDRDSGSPRPTSEPRFVQDWAFTTGGGYSFIRLEPPILKKRKSTGAGSHCTPRTASFRPHFRGTWRKDRQNILFWSYRARSRARARTRKGPHKQKQVLCTLFPGGYGEPIRRQAGRSEGGRGCGWSENNYMFQTPRSALWLVGKREIRKLNPLLN